MTISLPPAMVWEVERVRKLENRTRSELVREALRTYFESRFPIVVPSKAELAAIRRGRAAFRRGDYISLDELLDGMKPGNHRTSAKGPSQTSRRRPTTR